MKKLYTIGIALSMVAFGTQSMAQVKAERLESLSTVRAVATQSAEGSITRTATTKKTAPTPKDGEAVTYYSEDFSNGLGGQLGEGGAPDNGAWTVGDTMGVLWFQTFPVGSPNGYSATEAVSGGTNPEYGTQLPLLWRGEDPSDDIVNSPSRDNGVMMVDADRWNSLSTVENPLSWPMPAGADQDDYIRTNGMVASLMSPSIDLTGVDAAYLTFYQGGRLNTDNAVSLQVEVSVNNQQDWTTFNVYSGSQFEHFDGQVSLNITSLLQQTGADLSDVRVRFKWNGKMFVFFYWTIDDFAIVSAPDNDLTAGKTYTNNWRTVLNTVSAGDNSYYVGQLDYSQYLNAVEYYTRPQYYSHLYNFGMIVTNTGGATQTDVRLVVVATAPNGTTTKTWTSPDPIELEAGVSDTLWINDADLKEVMGSTVVPGTYKFNFSVIQEENDVYPDNNFGTPRNSGYTSEGGNQGKAIFQQGANEGYVVYNSEYTVNNGFDVTYATGYVFPELETGYEPKFITHVEVAFIGNITLNDDAGTQLVTAPGNDIFFNVRKNHPYNQEEGNESTNSIHLFGSDDDKYTGDDIVHTIAAEDLSSNTPYKWVSFELPTPVAIEPGVVYFPEIRVPTIGNDRVYLWGSGNDAPFTAFNYYFSQGADGTSDVGGSAPALRFRTAPNATGIAKISVESGLTLIQNYPNPFTDMTKIQYMVDKTSKVNFEVRDLNGKLVYTKDLGNIPANAPQSIELQRGNLAAGMYTYTIATSEFQVSRKLVVE